MNYWFTSDYHLGHANIIKYCNRPFKNLTHMNEMIIRNHNERVKKDDIVFHLGDFCFKNSSRGKEGEGIPVHAKDWESRLNGNIIHIRGNHDKNNSTKTIIQGLLIKYCNTEAYLVHKPKHYNPSYALNLVGHVHNNWRIKKPGDTLYVAPHIKIRVKSIMVNVGVDVNNFMPVKFTQILHLIKGI